MTPESLERGRGIATQLKELERQIQAARQINEISAEFFQDHWNKGGFFEIPSHFVVQIRAYWLEKGEAKLAALKQEFERL